ncbi:MAG: 50S ribosomal protein L10 [Terrimicrobiaceae bacterium]
MRPEKATIVADVQERLKNSPFAIIADFSGMQVKHFEELRSRLDTASAKIQVVKNTFIKRAAEELGLPSLNGSLSGQTALVTGENDICAAAKILKTFASEFEKPTLKAGILDNALLTADEVRALADLPSKEVLQATLLGLFLAPATRFVRVLNEPGASLARLLQAKAEKDGGAS